MSTKKKATPKRLVTAPQIQKILKSCRKLELDLAKVKHSLRNILPHLPHRH